MRTVQYNCGPRGDVHDGARDDPILHRERRLSVSVGRRRPKKRPVSVSHCFSSASDSFNLACPSFASDQIPFYSVYSPFHSFSFPFMRRFCSNRLRTAFFSVGRRIWALGPMRRPWDPLCMSPGAALTATSIGRQLTDTFHKIKACSIPFHSHSDTATVPMVLAAEIQQSDTQYFTLSRAIATD